MSTEATSAPPRTPCYIALGSNLAHPLDQVERAVEALAQLPQTELIARSPWYRSRAIGPGNQPDYINGVALLHTALGPEALFEQLQAIEADHGRERRVRWAARTLDLDILLYDKEIIATDRLQIPHPRLSERNFVIYPLADIDPDLVLPDGTSVASLLARCPPDGLVKLEAE